MKHWAPQEGPQEALVTCTAEDVFFGGARFGGKTDGLLGDFSAHERRRGKLAKGILFRRSYVELQEVVARSHVIYGQDSENGVHGLGWSYNVQTKTWTAPSGGTLRLAYLDRDKDAEVYQGASYDWMGFDEVGNWPSPTPIDKLWACLRAADGAPCYRRLTGNPGGPGHAWVKKRYIDGRTPLVPFRWQPNPELPHTIESVFIPSKLEDNKLAGDPVKYEARIAASGTTALFNAWRYGDWNVVAGQFFDIWDPTLHVKYAVPFVGDDDPLAHRKHVLQPWHPRWISMDWGFKDDCAIHWHAINEAKQVLTYREVVVNQMEPVAVGELIVMNTPKDEKIANFYLGGDAFAKRTSTRTIAAEIGDVTRKANLPMPARADDDRVGGWMLMYQMLSRGYWAIDPMCKILIESLPLLQRDEKKVEDCAASPVDHAPDSARYGLKTHIRRVTIPVEENVKAAMTSADPTIQMMQARVARSKFEKARPKPFQPRRRYA